MASVSSKYMNIFSAKQFRESVAEAAASNVYLTIGRSVSWTDENNPPQANTSVSSFYEVWDNMIAAKRISGNDVRHAIPRFDWTANTVYFQYDNLVDSKVLKSETNQFYVVTDDWNVYKCLSNNRGVQSTVKPTSISTISDIQTEDGYIWKYMYSVTPEEQLRFVTDDYIPVKSLTVNDGSLQWLVQNNAISGGIHNIVVENGGTYTANDISIIITGDGQDAAAIATRNTMTNEIETITVTNKGTRYSYATVTISSATGSGGVARAIISPKGGHGSDPLVELGGSNIIINTRIKSDEGGIITANNDYRQVAIIEDPYAYNGTTYMSDLAVNQLTKVTLNGTSAEYIEDETVYQGLSLSAATFSGTVVEWESANNILHLSNVRGIPSSDLVKGTESTAARFLSSITAPGMRRYTGNLLYINNLHPIERASDQVEDFKILIRF